MLDSIMPLVLIADSVNDLALASFQLPELLPNSLLNYKITNQPAGNFVVTPVIVRPGISQIKAVINRVDLSSSTLQINWSIELSQDDGQTWLPWGGAGTLGGEIINPVTQLPATISRFTVPLPNSASIRRQLKASITANETVTTTVVLDAS